MTEPPVGRNEGSGRARSRHRCRLISTLLGGQRGWLLEHLELILSAVAVRDHHEEDPRPGRERFYRQNLLDPGRWLRVIVDFNDVPAWLVTVLVQENDPREKQQ